ncbi:hypothetical protein [Alloyangia pacifica]|uniref:Uncharacterized protein n=1 Tax=Alloyangia pacifica TaxID=311180 RepID=A0A1I6PP91_9RHOB|nr:hypothetical protein [Alloyangia pacifica]SDG32576.1 hypothetical protein SAMN04488245_102376 [Alloyangia pacifica]SFS42009.1 hypothetical protein SAMN04488050_101677 [Alloyangia pacifica]
MNATEAWEIIQHFKEKEAETSELRDRAYPYEQAATRAEEADDRKAARALTLMANALHGLANAIDALSEAQAELIEMEDEDRESIHMALITYGGED